MKNLPKRQLLIEKIKNKDISLHTDRLGNVQIYSWIPGTPPELIAEINPFVLRKMKDWISKVIEYQDRK